MARIVSWFSCGAASAVATKLTLAQSGPRPSNPAGDVWIAYCETGAEHPENSAFMAACEDWFGQAVIRLKSDEYADTWDVWEKTRWLAGIDGARCTGELKLAPRLTFQRPDDVHVFGYTADSADVKRAAKLRANYPELTIKTPLIDAGLTKSAVLAMVQGAGVELPVMYRLGFHNNNCIPCVKATSPNYWAAIRRNFPDQFDRMAKLSRELGVRLTIVGREKGEDGKVMNIRAFIDEIPADQPTTNPIAPACDFLCHIAEQDIGEAA